MHIYFPRSLKKHIIAFNAINAQYYTENTNFNTYELVPIRYASSEKMVAWFKKGFNQEDETKIDLPIISSEIVSIDKDEERQLNILNAISSNDRKQTIPIPIPYNLTFDLSVWSKYQQQLYDIVEQILTKFGDNYNYPLITTKFQDGSQIINNISIELSAPSPNLEDIDINRESEQFLRYTFTFIMKGYIYKILKGDKVDSDGHIIDTDEGNVPLYENAIYIGTKINYIDLNFEEDQTTAFNLIAGFDGVTSGFQEQFLNITS